MGTRTMFTLIVLFLFFFSRSNCQSYDVIIKGDWGYNIINGPSTWHYTHPKCGGSLQSPLEIITRAVEDDLTGEKITLTGYQHERNASIINNGHTISIQFSDDDVNEKSISGGHLENKKFLFQQAHWHWGSVSTRGSEHHIDGVKDPMEIHLVHMNNKYTNLTEAFKHSDGV